MGKSILIIGGAGFIGSHLADDLSRHGHDIKILDNLSEQVHGPSGGWPSYLGRRFSLHLGDVRDPATVRRALQGAEVVYHLAARVGVGQSMYEVADYTSVNNMGTATLLEALAEQPVERLIVASSMSLYGEGLYRAPDGGYIAGAERTRAQLEARDWEPRTADGASLTPVPTPETKPPTLASVYALSKYDQEQMCLIMGRALRIPTVAMRFFNVYGPRQALSNPYTGVLAIFAARLMNNNPPVIYEDGLQRRDFVSVYDVARACRLALEAPDAAGGVFNIGSGKSRTVLELAERMARVLGRDIEPEISGKYRVGDIRHCFADISLARSVLGYSPQVELDDGMTELAAWLQDQEAEDRFEQAGAELVARGLTV